jgi:hypothetical protein
MTERVNIYEHNIQRCIHREYLNTMSLNQNLLVLIQNFCTWNSVIQLSASLLCSPHAYVTIHNEGVYIPFPSCALKLSNLHIHFYLLALTTINAFYLLRTRADHSRSVYILQVRSFLIISFKIGAITSK